MVSRVPAGPIGTRSLEAALGFARINTAREEEEPPPSRRLVVVKRSLSWSSRITVVGLALAILVSLFQINRSRVARERQRQEFLAEQAARAELALEGERALFLESPETPITVDPAQGVGAPEPESRDPEPVSVCPSDMVLIEGDFCPSVAHSCRKYISMARDRCAEFWETSRCFGAPLAKRFCIDRFEYPNLTGVLPLIAVDWTEARTMCRLSGKRLCTDNEWTLACEGPGRLPYPYGYMRDAEACNIDKPYIIANPYAYADPRRRTEEIARVDQREPSGSRAGCVSSFGVHDMTGNVDEWVLNESGFPNKPPYRSGLKGGYWGPVRNRCRPMTTDHNDWHDGYQIGFRCCMDPQDGGRAAPDGAGSR